MERFVIVVEVIGGVCERVGHVTVEAETYVGALVSAVVECTNVFGVTGYRIMAVIVAKDAMLVRSAGW